jgi:hypothetical protein
LTVSGATPPAAPIAACRRDGVAALARGLGPGVARAARRRRRAQPPRAGTLERTPWHHDQPYYPVDGEQIVSLWMPLDPVGAVLDSPAFPVVWREGVGRVYAARV